MDLPTTPWIQHGQSTATIGQKACEVGLADGVGHLVPVMKARFGDKVRFRRYEQKKRLFPRIGMSLAQDAMETIEERAAYARFGL